MSMEPRSNPKDHAYVRHVRGGEHRIEGSGKKTTAISLPPEVIEWFVGVCTICVCVCVHLAPRHGARINCKPFEAENLDC